MKKLLFVIATLYTVIIFLFVIPAFSVSSKMLIEKYDANEKEKAIIVEMYGNHSRMAQISGWSILVIYGLFTAYMIVDRRKPGQERYPSGTMFSWLRIPYFATGDKNGSFFSIFLSTITLG